MNPPIAEGTVAIIDGMRRVYYDGYWIKVYDPPADSLKAKKQLIQALTRRLFNHVEHGINIPGKRLDDTRRAYEAEQDPARKRVKGAMLAGALFNRATDTSPAGGVAGTRHRDRHRQRADARVRLLPAGGTQPRRLVLHRSAEGIDELWRTAPRLSIPVRPSTTAASRSPRRCATSTDWAPSSSTLGAIPMYDGIRKLIAHSRQLPRSSARPRTDGHLGVWSDFVVASEELAPRATALAQRECRGSATRRRRPAPVAAGTRPRHLHHPRPRADAQEHA